MGMGTQRPDFAEFYRRSKDECLFTVLLSVGTGIWLSPEHHPPGGPIALAAGLVHASPRCTGSSAGQPS
jgi:hypothetical protein